MIRAWWYSEQTRVSGRGVDKEENRKEDWEEDDDSDLYSLSEFIQSNSQLREGQWID
jgi:hypothetical protein